LKPLNTERTNAVGELMKVINIRFEFDDETWAMYKSIWTEAEIRLSLYEGAIGEVGDMCRARLEDEAAEPRT
jgi:hypothetical protein